MKNLAVEWLVDKLDLNVFESDEEVADIIQQAKEMEKNVATEYAEFCIRCDRAGLKQVKFEDWKKDWEETFK